MSPDAPVRGGRLEADQITVRFGGHQALIDVSLCAEPGRVTGLIGPNGAGKTTTFNVLCGLQSTVRGQVRLDGTDISGLAPHKRARLGLARTFQRLETFSLLTVRENVMAGAELAPRAIRRGRDAEATADALLERLGLGDVADEKVEGLPTGSARLVELGRALAGEPRVLLLDEPSSGLNEAETAAMGAVLDDLADDGLTIVLVEHDMSLVMGSCHDIYVLDFGKVLTRGTPAEVQADEQVQRAYLGDQRDEPTAAGGSGHPVFDDPSDAPLAPVIEVHDLCAGYGGIDVISDVSFEVAAGEVFALLGPNGGQDHHARRDRRAGARHERHRGPLRPACSAPARTPSPAPGSAPSPRAGASSRTSPSPRTSGWPASRVRRADIEERAYARFPRLGERREQLAGTMSGGEQQMLAMARALATDPALLILDELSMGLAPLVVRELYEQVAAIAAEGLSILVVEQFAHEVLGVADTAAIMLHGRIGRIGAPADIADELAAAYLTGATAD
ncbi:MAG: ATP-binding cassette domain-containing protein [Acidimicrobiales bacterium]